MFEQSFVDHRVSTRRGGPVALSLLLQFSVVATALLIPLLNPELLPKGVMSVLPLASPPPAPRPPAPEPVLRPVTRVVQRIWNGTVLTVPFRIPDAVARIVDEPEIGPTTGTGPGVPGGTGVPNGGGGLINDLVNSVRQVAPPPPAPPKETVAAAKPPERHVIGGNVQDAKLLNRVMPVYPVLARNARIEGVVRFTAIIGTNGSILNLQLVSGHPMLVQAASDAVRQWRYMPTLLNGDPVEVITSIEVKFFLNR